MHSQTLDVRSLLEAAFAVRDSDPEYFGLWLAQAYAPSDWHAQPTDGTWFHHASSLGECLRRHVLDRSGAPREELTVESLTTFEIGRHIHLLLQLGLAVHPDSELLGHEVGGKLEFPPLAAHADAVFRWQGGPVCLIDLKSERESAKAWRERDAAAQQRQSTAKPEHAVQLQATALVLRELCHPLEAEQGLIVYWSKDNGRIDLQPVQLGAAAVLARLEEREQAFQDRQLFGTLPPRLPGFPDKGLCTPRSKTDPRGFWCPFRQACAKEAA